MIKELQDAKEIYIYHKGCYGCGKTARLYDTLQKHIVNQLNHSQEQPYFLPKYQVRRIDFDLKWQEELESVEMSAPAAKIIKDSGDIFWIDYKELERKIKEEEEKCQK